MSKAAAKPSGNSKAVVKIIVDYTIPADEKVFDGADYEKFLHDRIKVDNKAGQLGDAVKIQNQKSKITVSASIPVSKRYIKYLTKKFLKKNMLTGFIRVVATKDGFQLRFPRNYGQEEDGDSD